MNPIDSLGASSCHDYFYKIVNTLRLRFRDRLRVRDVREKIEPPVK